jgi:signal transduction histidine kinase
LIAVLAAFFAELAFATISRLGDQSAEITTGHGFAGVILIYALCRWLEPRQVMAGLAAISVSAYLGELLHSANQFENFSFVVPWMIVAMAALAMRYRARLIEQQHAQVRLTERNTLARELHDTVAHHVSAIAVQAQAAQYVAPTDPQAAADAMKAIETIANNTIDEMRRMVGILRSDDDQARSVVASSLVDLADPDGQPRVTLIGQEELDALPTPIAAAVYRICQESITNARRHSRGATFIDVDVTFDKSTVELLIDNDGAPSNRHSGSGYGLIGMRERVEALGGTLVTGPRPISGWQVQATIPMHRNSDRVVS